MREPCRVGGQRDTPEVDDGEPRPERTGHRNPLLGEPDGRLALVAGGGGEPRQPPAGGESPLAEGQRQRRDLQPQTQRRADQRRGRQALEVAVGADVDTRGTRLGGQTGDPLAAVGAQRPKLRRQKPHAPTEDSALIRISTLL